jgi:predicted RNA-binding protein with PUA-like domain
LRIITEQDDLGGPGSPRSNAWIFQANPKVYRIEESLQREREELWNLRQHSREVRIGDRVLIWLSGPEAGIYAVGTAVSPVVLRADSADGQRYWEDPSEGRRARARIRVRYDHALLDRPLRKTYLEADPALWNLSILRAPRQTNFVITPEEWQALKVWLGDDLL